MKTLFVLALLSICAVSGTFAQDASYDAQKEMKTEMRIIVNELKLEPVKIAEVGVLMEGRRDRKAAIASQIRALQDQMAAEDARSEKEIKAALTSEQVEKYDTVIKPKLQALRQEK